LAVIEPHVDVTVEGAGGAHLEFRRPAYPVDGVLVGMPLVQHLHIIVLKHDVFSTLLSSSAGNESLLHLASSTLTHLLCLCLKCLLHVFFGGMQHLFLSKLIEKVSNIPSLHVTQLVTSPDNSFLWIVVNGSDGEVSHLRGLRLREANLNTINSGLSTLMRDLLLNIQFSLSAEQSVFNITRRNCVEVKVAFNISSDYAVSALDKLADEHRGELRVIRDQGAFKLVVGVIV